MLAVCCLSLTPHGEPHLFIEVAQGVGADLADVAALVGQLGGGDDQRRVHGGVAVFEAHAARPRPERCKTKNMNKNGNEAAYNSTIVKMTSISRSGVLCITFL